MSGCVNLVSLVGITTSTSVSGVALFGTGRINSLGLVLVSGCLGLISLVGVATCTSVSGVTLFGASRSSYRSLVLVSGGGDLLGRGVVAVSTSGGGITSLSTGRINGLGLVAVSGCLGLVAGVRVSTACTGIGGITACGAGRSGNNRIVAVSCNLSGLAADVTGSITSVVVGVGAGFAEDITAFCLYGVEIVSVYVTESGICGKLGSFKAEIFTVEFTENSGVLCGGEIGYCGISVICGDQLSAVDRYEYSVIYRITRGVLEYNDIASGQVELTVIEGQIQFVRIGCVSLICGSENTAVWQVEFNALEGQGGDLIGVPGGIGADYGILADEGICGGKSTVLDRDGRGIDMILSAEVILPEVGVQEEHVAACGGGFKSIPAQVEYHLAAQLGQVEVGDRITCGGYIVVTAKQYLILFVIVSAEVE